MSVGLIENVGKSFGYAVDNTLKKILRWIGLTIVMCIPIVNFIAMGLFLKVFRGEEPDFSNAGKSFIQGLLLFIISIIYMIIPIIAFVILGGASFITAIIAPAGSIKDADVIQRANELGVALYYAPERIFSHH